MKKLLCFSPLLAIVMMTSGCYYTEPAVVVRPAPVVAVRPVVRPVVRPAVVVRPARPAVVVRPRVRVY